MCSRGYCSGQHRGRAGPSPLKVPSNGAPLLEGHVCDTYMGIQGVLENQKHLKTGVTYSKILF